MLLIFFKRGTRGLEWKSIGLNRRLELLILSKGFWMAVVYLTDMNNCHFPIFYGPTPMSLSYGNDQENAYIYKLNGKSIYIDGTFVF